MKRKQRMDAATALKIICAEAAQAYYYMQIKAGVRKPMLAGGLSVWMRLKVLDAYEHSCNHCGATDDLEIDHIWPLSKGGLHWEVNLQVLCSHCNKKKGNSLRLRSPEALAVLVPILGPGLRRVLRWAWLVVAWLVALIVAHPVATAAVVGGIAAYFAVRWLRERDETDGDRRYVRIGRAAKASARERANGVREGAANLARGFKGGVGSVSSLVHRAG